MGKLKTPLIFGAIAILGAVSLGVIALHKGESISAVWMVVAAVCTYAIAYRFYARYLANKVMGWMHGGSHVHDYPDFVLLRRVGGRLGG